MYLNTKPHKNHSYNYCLYELIAYTVRENSVGFIYKKMNIQELFKAADGANITLSVTPSDLKEFALAIIEEVKEKEEEKPEEYMTPADVMKICGVSSNTLWRWNRDKYLCPIKFGNRNFYKRADIEKLMEG